MIKLPSLSISWIWYYPMLKSSDVAYWETSNSNNILLILGIGYGLWCNCLFRFLMSLRNINRFYLGLGCSKDGNRYFESFVFSRTPSRTKRSTSSLTIPLCTFGTGYGLENIGFASSFNSNSTESVFRFPSVPSNNSSIFVIIITIHYIVYLEYFGIGFPSLI